MADRVNLARDTHGLVQGVARPLSEQPFNHSDDSVVYEDSAARVISIYGRAIQSAVAQGGIICGEVPLNRPCGSGEPSPSPPPKGGISLELREFPTFGLAL